MQTIRLEHLPRRTPHCEGPLRYCHDNFGILTDVYSAKRLNWRHDSIDSNYRPWSLVVVALLVSLALDALVGFAAKTVVTEVLHSPPAPSGHCSI